VRAIRTMIYALAIMGPFGCGVQAAEPSPREVYDNCIKLILHKDFALAYSLLDQHAKADIANGLRGILETSGISRETTNQYSDYEIFSSAMTYATTTKIEIGEEKIDGDYAILEVTSYGPQGAEKHTISLVRSGGHWLIHSGLVN